MQEYGSELPREQGTNRLSVVAFVSSLLIFLAPLSAILGHIALKKIRKNGGAGRGFARFAIVLGWITTPIVVWLVLSPYSFAYTFGYVIELLTP